MWVVLLYFLFIYVFIFITGSSSILYSHSPKFHFSCVQLKVPTSDKPGYIVTFRKLLLNRCQKEFEKDQDDDEFLDKKQKEMEAAKDVRNHVCRCVAHFCTPF